MVLSPKDKIHVLDARDVASWVGVVIGALVGLTNLIRYAGGSCDDGVVRTKAGQDGISCIDGVSVLGITLITFVPYCFLGSFDTHMRMISLLLAPFAFFGAWLRVKIHVILPARLFVAVMSGLSLMGGILPWDSGT